MKVIVKYGVVWYNGNCHQTGQEIELSEEQGLKLLATGNVEQIKQAEDETAAGGPPKPARGRPRTHPAESAE